jgi:hypothetical protein
MRIRTFVIALLVFLVLVSEGNFQAQVQAQARGELFVINVYKVGNGSGVVVSSPPGIDCGDGFNDCSAAFPRGTAVSLRPRALHGGSEFKGWSVVVGSTIQCPATRGNCNMILMENSSIQAEFVLD